MRASAIWCRVARSSFTAEQCTENVLAVVKAAAEHVSKKWANVQSLHLKTADSAALPIYQAVPEAPKVLEGTS